MRVKELCAFIKERENVRMRKEAGKKRPWTKDPILATYRFCNVHREDDRVTRWIAYNWRDQPTAGKDLWFALVIARLFNNPETLLYIGYPLPYKPGKLQRDLDAWEQAGRKVFNAAYIVSTNGKAMKKVPYLFAHVLAPLWAARERLRPKAGQTLAQYHFQLMGFDGLGSFMAAQVVADLKYVEPLRSAIDWQTWAAPGPGSKRGLNRVRDEPVDAPWPGLSWKAYLDQLLDAVNGRLASSGIHLHAQDLQNCLCEFDKYERARTGEGKPKQLYKERKL